MKLILTAALLGLCVSNTTAQVSFVTDKPTEALALADSLAAYARHSFHIVKRKAAAPTSPAFLAAFAYEAKEVDSAAINWNVVAIHRQTGMLTNDWKPDRISVSFAFDHQGDTYKLRKVKGYLDDLFPFWRRFIDPGADLATVKRKRYAQATVTIQGKPATFKLQEYGLKYELWMEE